MNIAVTGQNGFLGKHLVARLQKEQITYTPFDREKYNLLDPLSLKEFVSNKDIIVHMAGLNRDTNFNLLNINVMASAGIMEAVSFFNPEAKIIFVSSSQVYSQENIYGLSNKMAEDVIEKYSDLFGIQALSLRISNIFGPGCKPYYNSVIATFIDQIRQGKKLSINGDGSQKKDFIYVDDVVGAFMQAMRYKPGGTFENFDICFGREYSINEIIHELENITKKPIEVQYNNKVQIDVKEIVISNKNAREKLGWEPKVALKEGLEKICA